MKKWRWFFLSAVVIVLDQLTKQWALQALMPYQPKAIMPMLNIFLAYNTGAAFSFLSSTGDWHRWFFSGFSALMSVALVVWIMRLPKTARLPFWALALILGGAVGNLIDRLRFGHVIDFIDVYYKTHHWPVFNLADSAICIGAFLLFIDMWVSEEKGATKLGAPH